MVFFLLINFCSKFYDIDRISDFGVCLVMCVSGVVWFCGKYVGGGKIFFLCEYFWWVGGVFLYVVGRLVVGRNVGWDCGVGL